MKKIQWLRNGLFLLFVVSLLFLGNKSYQVIAKITTTNKAEDFYNSKQYAKADAHVEKVIYNQAVNYKEKQIKTYFKELSRNKKLANSFYTNAEKAYKKEDFKGLFNSYSNYVKTVEDEANNKIFIDFDTHFQTKEKFSTLFSTIQQNSYKQMEANIKENIYKNEFFILILGKLPAKVYGGKAQKSNELLKLFRQYDSNKYSFLEKNLAFDSLKDTITKQISSYEEVNIDPTWLRSNLKAYQHTHDKQLAKLETERKKREEELRKAKEAELAAEKAAAEAEKANDSIFQEEIMTVVNDYAEGWMDAYNNLDSSYFVNITPELRSFFEERFEGIRANNAQFIGELLYNEFDLDSFEYRNDEGVEMVELDVVLSMNSASYEYGDYYEMEETSTPWHYSLMNDGFGWQLSARKEISHFNYANTEVYQFGYNY
jgi:hypothetical protein